MAASGAEGAFLATLKIKDRVRVKNGQVMAVKILPLCPSFDHQVIDGAAAARTINALIKSPGDPAFLQSFLAGKQER
jgi:pyruvate/2-oxoglutarate dehydrogenase complex dihydrolipoamide acyltransferase (E2) component